MTGLENVVVNILVAGDAGVGADVKVLQVAHSRGGAVGPGVIFPRVRTQPVFRRTMAAFARDTFTHLEKFAAKILGNRLQRRMAGSAARVYGGILDVERVGDLLRPRGGERGRRTMRMKIFLRPDEKLISFAAAMATGAGIRAEKFWRHVRATNRTGRHKNQGGKTGGLATKCFTHGVKLVNGVDA